ncbi:eCIS core domain-containing protein [Lyngbya confervoides]|uniref:DUF4157 domain-containing protein n=1 Tax=Lyngbya confervoides BDU141951 TaxID=1574623 RepID=A0ABD4T498_9CYAN|nr:DUF4157 domain-containing protein [Lyngbya confervoides]MCM1983265.1 DUF4157 domain-containing protein [Lyngbya confervoides BDU141951]
MTFTFAKPKTKPVAVRKGSVSKKLRPKQRIDDRNVGSDLSALTRAIAPVLQPKLKIGEPNDQYEQEVDRVADQIMRIPETQVQTQLGSIEEKEKKDIQAKFERITVQRTTAEEREKKTIQTKLSRATIQRMCTECNAAEEKILQAKSEGSLVSAEEHNVQSGINRLRKSGGSTLPAATRTFMESRFGYDFSNIKIHTGPQANDLSRRVNARAFTVGHDIFFTQGEFHPTTPASMRLLAHELTHTIQQTSSSFRLQRPIIQRKKLKRATKKNNENELRKSAWNPFFVHYDFKMGNEREKKIILEEMVRVYGGEFATEFKKWVSKPNAVPGLIQRDDRDGPKLYWLPHKIKERGFILHRVDPGVRERLEHWVHPHSTYLQFSRSSSTGPDKGESPVPHAEPNCIDSSADPESVFGPNLGCEETDVGPPDGWSKGLACLYANGAIEFIDFALNEKSDVTEYYIPNSEGDYIQFPLCGDEEWVVDPEMIDFEPGEIFPSLSQEGEEE